MDYSSTYAFERQVSQLRDNEYINFPLIMAVIWDVITPMFLTKSPELTGHCKNLSGKLYN